MTDPLLRHATPTDTAAIIDLHHAALRSVMADAGPGPGDDDLNDIRQHYLEPGGEFLVLETNAQIIAMGALRRTGPTTAEVKRMRVHPDHQGSGHGRLLLNTLEERAVSRGIRS
ncbi:hypothetical protein GCM10022223_13150 [Kineosporia mesophila]|uniref:N-acetyltransferase domain-containing protein n=1 Tax=Kineosporia mesophila TaxID=566012 RepID=A0ABP6Z598_9ACTN|nr:GNAT family N-acetyltransferase [Kineosporia mesophila]MCD5354950.1 GNAT family N-acetyltransferase [Kineosporia mesophila]